MILVHALYFVSINAIHNDMYRNTDRHLTVFKTSEEKVIAYTLCALWNYIHLLISELFKITTDLNFISNAQVKIHN